MRRKKAPNKKASAKKRPLSVTGFPKGGRPTEYSGEILELVKRVAKLGHTEFEIAQFLGINQSTLWRWKSEHPPFCKALQLGKRAADKRMEASLYHRGVGYSHEDVHVAVIEGKVVLTPIVKHYPPAEGAMKLWLTNRDPRRWREIKSSVIQTPPGQPIEHRHTYGQAEALDEYYRRAATAESLSESAAAEGDPDLGEGDPPG